MYGGKTLSSIVLVPDEWREAAIYNCSCVNTKGTVLHRTVPRHRVNEKSIRTDAERFHTEPFQSSGVKRSLKMPAENHTSLYKCVTYLPRNFWRSFRTYKVRYHSYHSLHTDWLSSNSGITRQSCEVTV